MRQISQDELAYALAGALRGITVTLRKQWAAGTPEQQRQARGLIAAVVADKLHRFEVLSDGPLPEVMGDRAFSQPMDRMIGDG